jgi:hypothetical protein
MQQTVHGMALTAANADNSHNSTNPLPSCKEINAKQYAATVSSSCDDLGTTQL